MEMSAIFILYLIILLVIGNKCLGKNKKLFNPISILLFVWIAVIIIHSLYWPSSEYIFGTYVWISIGLTILVFGFVAGTKGALLRQAHNPIQNYRTYNLNFLNKLIIWFLLIEALRILYLFYLVVYQFAGGQFLYFLLNSNEFRMEYVFRNSSFIEKVFTFSTNLLAYIGFVIIGVYSAKKGKHWKLLFIITSISEFIISTLSMSKLAFTLYIITFIVAYFNNIGTMKVQKASFKKILPFIFIILILFFLFIGYQRNYMQTKEGGLVASVYKGIIDYFAGPVEAFSMILYKHNLRIGHHGMINIGGAFTNVYTFFAPFYKYCSYAGFFIFPLLIGFLLGSIYDARANNLFADTSNAWTCTLLSMSFFDCLFTHLIFILLFVGASFLNFYFKRKLYLCRLKPLYPY